MARREQVNDAETAGVRAQSPVPARRRFLAGGAVLAAALGLAALMLAAWPVPPADAAKIICVWDNEQKKWVCYEESHVGSVAPAVGPDAAPADCPTGEMSCDARVAGYGGIGPA